MLLKNKFMRDLKKILLSILLFASTISFAQSDNNNHTTTFSGGANIGYRFYNSEKTTGIIKDNHITYGAEAEANIHLFNNMYLGAGAGLSYYKAGGETLPVKNLYVQPCLAFNLNNGRAVFFTGLRTELIFDDRFFGYGVAPFVRIQYNLSEKYCLGYHFGANMFGGEKWSLHASNTTGPSPEYYGLSLVNYLYIGFRLHK